MAKKLILGLILARFGPNLVHKIFFHGKLMKQTLENENARFCPIWPKFGPPVVFQKSGSVSQ